MKNGIQFNILLVESNPDIASLLTFALETQFGVSIVEANDEESALQLLEAIDHIDLAIIGDLATSKKLSHKLLSSYETTQTILCVSEKLEDPSILLFPQVIGVAKRATMFDEVVRIIQEKCFSGEIIDNQEPTAFVRVKPRLLLKVYPLTSDVYIGLSKQKYLKLFPKGSHFDLNDFERYANVKHIEHFYIRRQEAKEFFDHLRNEIDKVLNSSVTDHKQIHDLALDLQEASHHLISVIGVTEEVQEMTKTNVKLILKTVNNNHRVNDALNRFRIEQGQYIPQHSLMLSEVACAIAAEISWVSDLTFQKLILASLFHDISLKSHELARARSLEEVQNHPELTLKETLNDFKLHPVRGADLVNQLQDISPDVDVIIKQHHEDPEGNGFPTGVKHKKIAPLSSLFIIAHEFVDFYLELSKEDRENAMPLFIQKFSGKFSQGFFGKIMKELSAKQETKIKISS